MDWPRGVIYAAFLERNGQEIQSQMVHSDDHQIQKAATTSLAGGAGGADYWHFHADFDTGRHR